MKIKKQEKTPREEENGILLLFPTRVTRKMFSVPIDSGATRCFVTPVCHISVKMMCVFQYTFLELENGVKILFRGVVWGAQITPASMTTSLSLG